MAQLIPCRNPKLCGVKNHYPNTASKCSATKIAQGSLTTPPPVPHSVYEESVPSEHLDSLPVAVQEAFLSERPRTGLFDISETPHGVQESYRCADVESGVITLSVDTAKAEFFRMQTRKIANGRTVLSRDPKEGPAFVNYGDDGLKNFEEYRLDGVRCPRPDGGPSVIRYAKDGEVDFEEWDNPLGLPHRTDGPAIRSRTVNSWRDEYYLDGKKYDSKEEHEKALQHRG